MMEVFCLHHLFLQPPSVGNSGKQEIMTRGFLRSLYLKVFVYREFYLYLGWIFTWWLGNFVRISWASHYGLENSEIYSLKCSTWWFNSSSCLVVLISKFKFDFDVCSGHQVKTHMSTLPICLLLHAWSTLTGLLFYGFFFFFFLVTDGSSYLHIHPKFLHSNATSHKWAFGGMYRFDMFQFNFTASYSPLNNSF